MSKYIEIETDDSFDDQTQTTYEALDRHVSISPASQIRKRDLEDVLVTLENHYLLDPHPGDSGELAEAKAKGRRLVEQVVIENGGGLLGRVWFTADDANEALTWQLEYMFKGAAFVRLEPEEDRPQVHVFITLDKSQAKEVLGYTPDEEEWLED